MILSCLLVCMQMRNIPSSENSMCVHRLFTINVISAGAVALVRWVGADHYWGTSVDGHNTEDVTVQNFLSRTVGMTPCK